MPNQLSTTREISIRAASDDERLVQILDHYLSALDRGEPVSPEDLVAQHPDVAERLRGYLSGLRLFQGVIGTPSAQLSPVENGESGLELRGSLGDFRLVREIGRGGMGVVYEAVQISLGRRVAVKILPFTAAIDEKQIMRFKNEAQAAAQVDHPNIVPVFAIGHEHGIHYFAMQFIGGQSLSKLLDTMLGNERDVREVPIDVRETVTVSNTHGHVRNVARMGIQAAEALHAAHEIGVVHRDVKPSNLLLDEKGKVWVTDFGVARCITSASLTSTGHALGTIRYMSPEQAQGHAALIDHRTDIYSLGVTLYEMACLRHPFEGIADAALAFEFGRSSLRGLRYWNSSIPEDFENIVLKAISDERDERYSTAREMAEDLERFLQGQPIIARRPSVLSRISRWARLHNRSVAAGVGVLAATLLVAVISLVLIASERSAKEEALRLATANHTRAEERNQSALQTIDNALRSADCLQNVPGAEGIRRDLLKSVLGMYRKFAADADNQAAVQPDIAMTHSKIGYLLDQLGRYSEAEIAYRDSQKVFEQLHSREPRNWNYLRNLALCGNNLGQLLKKMGQSDEAAKELARALTLQEELADLSPGEDAQRSDLAATRSNLGLLANEAGDSKGAEVHFRAAAQIHETIFKSAPGDVANRSRLAASYNNLGSLFLQTDAKLAQSWVEKALSLQLNLVQENPKQLEYQSDLALSYNNLGTILSRQSNWADAEKCFLDAITIRTRLAAVAPLVTAHRRGLSVSYNNLGMTQSRKGSFEHAQASFRNSLAIHERLVKTHKNDVSLLSELGGIYNNLGNTHERRGLLDDAEAAFGQSIKCQRVALERAPDSLALRESLKTQYRAYSQVLRKLGRPAEATEAILARRDFEKHDPVQLYRTFLELAANCKLMESGPPEERCFSEALATLSLAWEAGFAAAPGANASPLETLWGSVVSEREQKQKSASQAAKTITNERQSIAN